MDMNMKKNNGKWNFREINLRLCINTDECVTYCGNKLYEFGIEMRGVDIFLLGSKWFSESWKNTVCLS